MDTVAAMPYVVTAAFFAMSISLVQGGIGVLWGWPGPFAVGYVAFTAVALRSFLKFRNQPRPERISARRLRALAVFSLMYGSCVSAYFATLSLTGTVEMQTTVMGLAIIGIGVTLGINSISTAVFFAMPLVLSQWSVAIWTGLLPWWTASALFAGISWTALTYSLRNRAKTLDLIRLQLANEAALSEKLEAEEELRLAEVAAAKAEQDRHAEAARVQRSMIDAVAFPLMLTRDDALIEVSPQARSDFALPDEVSGEMSGLKALFANRTDHDDLVARADGAGGKLDDVEVIMRDTTGREFWCAVSMRTLELDGAPARLVSVFIIDARKKMEHDLAAARDAAEDALSELKAAQTQLVHAEKMASLGELTAGIAHEIKNPLNFINNFSRLSAEMMDELTEILADPVAALAEDDRDEAVDLLETVTGNLRRISEHGARADGIVRNMLAHSRDAGGERQVIALAPLVKEAVTLAWQGARAAQPGLAVDLHVVPVDGAPHVATWPQELQRVILNLCANAIHAAATREIERAEEPAVTVHTRMRDGQAIIAIGDNGDGVPEALRSKIFQPFFTTKPAGQGTGLGLSLSFDIIRRHGGQLALDPDTTDGACFLITLPLAEPDSE